MGDSITIKSTENLDDVLSTMGDEMLAGQEHPLQPIVAATGDDSPSTTRCEERDKDEMFSLHQTRKMPIDGLPVYMREIIEEFAEALVAPVDFVAAGALVTAATAAGKRCSLRMGSYVNHPNLWLTLVAPSGFNKTAPIKFMLEPLVELDQTNYLQYMAELAMIKNKKETDIVRWKQIIVSDITPEARNQVLMHNPNRLLTHCDELQEMMDNFQRYNKGGEVPQMLKIWDNANYSVNRKKDAPLCISDPYMNVVGGVQPSVLPSTFGKAQFMGNGWNHRFLFIYPELDTISKIKPREINSNIRGTWNNVVSNWVHSYDEREELLILSDGAQQIYDRFFARILDEIDARDDDYIRSMLSKFRVHILRLAATVQVMYGGREISGEIMEYCERLCDYFLECALLVYGQISCEKPVQRIGNEELLRQLFDRYKVKSQNALAPIIGISPQQISKALKKN